MATNLVSDPDETKPETTVQKNNSFPDDILNISKFPTFMLHAISEHFYTTIKYKVTASYDPFGRNFRHDYIEYLLGKLIKPYYPESVRTYSISDGVKEHYSVEGSAFVVPLKKYIKGLYLFVTINDEPTGYNNERRYTLTFIGRGHEKFAGKFNQTLFDYIRGKHDKRHYETTVTTMSNSGEGNARFIPSRTISSVILADDIKEDVLDSVRKFKNEETKSYYKKIGEAWHYNLLLYGEPGTGKTSFANALATELKCPMIKIDGMYLSNYGTDKFKGQELMDIESQYLQCVFLFDEVDLYTYNRSSTATGEESAQKQMLLSALLEFLDQVGNGHIVILCTNHIDRLDPALIRSGRINKKIHFDLWDIDSFYKRLDRSNIDRDEFMKYADKKDIKYYIDTDKGVRYYPSVVSDICKEMALQKFWNE